MLELTSVNYLKFPRKPGMDGELGMGGLLLPVLGVCATPSQTGFGDGGDPSRDASMGLQPWSWRGRHAQHRSVPPLPQAPRIVPKGAGRQVTPAGRERRQAEVAGPGKVPPAQRWHSGGEDGGGPRRWGSPRPSRR